MITNVAITGSSGRNSAAWTDAFISAGFSVRNLVRRPDLLPKQTGRQGRSLDLDDSSTYEAALRDVDTLALITPSDPDQVKREIGLIEAAKKVGVRRIIKLSVTGADYVFPASVFARWHAEIEDALRGSDLAHVILRPNFFMQNALLQKASIEAGVYSEPLGTAAISYVDVRDVAGVAVVAARGNLDGEALTLTGPEAIDGGQVSAFLSAAIGREVTFVSPDLASFREELAARQVPGWRIDALANVYARVQASRAPHTAAVSADLESVTGRAPRNFREFAVDAFAGRRSLRRPAYNQVSARLWHHLSSEDLSRERAWPIGFRL